MKRFVVTGGAGFIGSELVRQLIECDATVMIIDNLVNGKIINIKDCLGPQCTLVEGDIRDSRTLDRIPEDTDILFHLACLGVRHSIHSPLENHDVNATGTLRLLETCRSKGVKRFVYVSTSEVYGTARTVPMPESHPTYPMTVYGASKLAGEAYTRAFHVTYNYATTIVRPFNSYGPRSHHEGDSGEVIPKFMLRSMAGKPMIIFGDGSQTRDFTFVSDTAAGIIQAGMASETIGKTMNLGSGRETTIRNLANEIAAVLGHASATIEYDDPRPGDVLRLLADTSVATQLIKFVPKVTLREGLVKLHAWQLSQNIPVEKLLEAEVIRNWEVKQK